MTRKSRQRI